MNILKKTTIVVLVVSVWAGVPLLATATTTKIASTTKSVPINGKNAVNKLVDINSADASTLATVRGIGIKRAEAIVSYRQQHGAFSKVSDLTRVPGIGATLLTKISSQLTVTQ